MLRFRFPIVIIDEAPTIMEARTLLEHELRLAAARPHVSSLADRLEGWWFRRVVEHLCGRSTTPILSEELDDTLRELREQFRRDNLPIDDDILAASIDDATYGDHVFVHQLRAIGLAAPRILMAVRDYYRAFTQRSRWVRETLLLVGELETYERRLVEEWERAFETMRQELGAEASEQRRLDAALALYKWMENSAVLPIRPSCTEPFVARGSYQMLADGWRVGWHPEFRQAVQTLLDSRAPK